MALPNPPEENQESVLRKIAEEKINQQIRKKGRKVVKKIAKKGMQLTAKAAVKATTAFAKLIVSILGAIGVPVILFAVGVLFLIIIISLVTSYMYGTGEGLNQKEKQLYNYIVEQANQTVNMKSDFERQYRVPEELIAAVIQLDIMSKYNEKEVIKIMAQALAPTFEYDKYNEWIETKTQVCENNKCAPPSKAVRKDNWVTKISSVDAWDGNTSFTYTPYETEWKIVDEKITYRTETYYEDEKYTNESGEIETRKVEKTRKIEVKTITWERRQLFESSVTHTKSYAMLDQVLNSFGLGLNDKRLIELNFLFSGGTIDYINWLQSGGFGVNPYVGFNGTIIPGAGVPTQFMEFYLSAEARYGVPWYVLAAIHFVETGFSTHPTMVSSVGAIGPMQFMPATWAGWRYNIGGGRVSPSLDITDLNVIRAGGGYGVDGNGDGKADPWDVADAIHTAAHYLSKNGYAQDPRKAIWHYNHAEWYVNKVLKNAEQFKLTATYMPNDMPAITDGAFMRPTTGEVTSGFGPRWGKLHAGVDIGKGGRNHAVPIVAVADGVVSRSYYSSSYGNVVFIKHNINGQQFETVYAHMENRAVVAGQTVKKGQYLGNMGNTGRSTGPHLHFEIHIGSWTVDKKHAVDPVLYIPF
jgi:hypothetical protein